MWKYFTYVIYSIITIAILLLLLTKFRKNLPMNIFHEFTVSLIIPVYYECDIKPTTVAEYHPWPRMWAMCSLLSCVLFVCMTFTWYQWSISLFSLTLSHNPIMIRGKCQLIFCITKNMNKENCVTQNFLCGREKSNHSHDFISGAVHSFRGSWWGLPLQS